MRERFQLMVTNDLFAGTIDRQFSTGAAGNRLKGNQNNKEKQKSMGFILSCVRVKTATVSSRFVCSGLCLPLLRLRLFIFLGRFSVICERNKPLIQKEKVFSLGTVLWVYFYEQTLHQK